MDRLEALGNQLSQITMYDIKSMYEQAKNVVLNVSEIEAKVREATNDDPWGASSTLMQEIASRTFNYPDFNEIMPSIYSRFMEKEARQWRQIYKSLQLLEYLIKHGSERVVDDARAHISTIKMLRNFHYIDDKGKDQGINVRNRAKEIVELLSDVEKIRAERRKAKNNKNKYTGQGSDGMSFGSGSYGGFGSDSGYGGNSSSNYGSYGGGGYGNSDRYGGSGGGGSGSSSFRDDNGRRGFEEYNAGDDEDVTPSSARRSNSLNTTTTTTSRSAPSKRETAPAPAAPAPAPAPVQEVDLLGGFDDDAFGSTVSAPPAKFATDKALPAVGAPKQPAVGIDDDDFADFQAAPTSPVTAAPAPPAAAPKMNLMNMLNNPTQPPMTTSPPPMQGQQSLFNMGGNNASGMGMGMGMGMGAGMGMNMGMHRSNTSMSGSSQFSSTMQPTSPTGFSAMRPTMSPTPSTTSAKTPVTNAAAASKPAASSGTSSFDDLWSMSLGSSKPAANAPVKSMKDLEKEKSSAGIWGGAGGAKPPMGSNMGSFGAFGGSSSGVGNTSGGGGGDDLLL